MPPLSLALTPLFSPHAISPAITWRTALSTFKAVDDRVRGGSSTSQTNLTASGQLLFSGLLDTTTLGGAGFASQQYGQPLPITLDKAGWQGLEVKVCSPPPSQKGGKEGKEQPGGGKGPVTSYVLNLYTTMPVKRPDGRNESSTVYEYNFNVSTSSAEVSTFHPAWSDFEPTYRGRPQPSAPELDPEEIKMWSIMARSDFGNQSGPFELVVDSISAVKKGDSKKASLMTKRGISEDQEDNEWLRPARLDGAKGFALYAFSTVLLVAWSVWALVPEAWLKAVGVDWYPSREWAYLIPAWSMVLVLFVYVAYMAYGVYSTPASNDLASMTDSHAKWVPIPRASDMSFAEAQKFIRDGGHPMVIQQQAGRGTGMLSEDVYDVPVSVVGR